MTSTTAIPQDIQDFVKLLDESGLPEERKEYWIKRLSEGSFNPADESAFMKEMNAQAANLDEAIAFTEATLANARADYALSKAAMLPYLQQIAAAQPACYSEETEAYKAEIGQAQQEMMHDLGQLRAQSNEAEIEAIRKKIAGG